MESAAQRDLLQTLVDTVGEPDSRLLHVLLEIIGAYDSGDGVTQEIMKSQLDFEVRQDDLDDALAYLFLKDQSVHMTSPTTWALTD